MKSKITIFITIILAIVFVNPLKAQVKSDYDKQTDFSKFKTYSFAGWEKESNEKISELNQKRILDALVAEFEARGIKHVESNGDAKITLFVVVESKIATTAYTTYNGSMGYRGRWGWGMGYGYATTNYTQDDYKEGTLVIDMYSEQSKDLIWQGVVTTTLEEKAEKMEKSINKNIGKLMKKYPVKPVKK
jgi:hypothetical protein